MKKSEQKKRKPCKINGVEIPNITTPKLINYKRLYLSCTPISLLGGIASLSMVSNFKDNLFFDIMLLSFGMLCLGAVLLSIKMLTNINRELKNREISKDDRITANKDFKKTLIIILIIAIAGCILLTNAVKRMVNDITGYDFLSNQCHVCEQTFEDSSNKLSISRTNMCEDCYDNYKYVKDSLDEDL